ncbi:MAG: hypothetical protein KAS32_26115 [Candidatus Peribacteraceae bacterium]|nr:hypothetical protein [Candidatus Peribacteraceae bacterium]
MKLKAPRDFKFGTLIIPHGTKIEVKITTNADGSVDFNIKKNVIKYDNMKEAREDNWDV